ncbi:NfeD-like partner-binding protein [Breznakibacter xylanolyticus]|uniref:NfeD-like partner-binding protein n=1 Tax=Breznakibacter xylanolyticus TaxID=990 RepID=A0A2W7N1B2_9BACT|nr:NfeD family protein [Breznakibacter xylanolyticus]MBN2742581.1 hypothetical protein [Marinilabiliaceae bacterium]PZX13553.1 NfeD-like partner-binding protein [Breznakibacter xylanolyticus]
MTTLVIVLLILTGLILLLLEFFVIPGVTVVGVAGALLIAAGIFFTYRNFGPGGGHIALIITLLAGLVMVLLALRSKTWDRLALKSEIDSNITTVDESCVKEGDDGITISRLNPIGKAQIGNQIIEAHCPGHFIDEKTPVQVVKVHKTYIIVKPLN